MSNDIVRFLLAKIHLDLLARYQHKSLFERALVHLPQSLTEAYGEAMKQVVGQSAKATSYVYWTLYSLRPLTVGELKYATNSTDSEAEEGSISFEHSLQTQSAGLLTVNAVSGTVRFVHRTAKEYLSGAPSRVFFPSAQKDIAEVCLTAVTPDEVVDDCYYNGGNPPRSSGNGFLGYAAMNWGFHAREVSEDETTIQVLIKTFLNKLLWRRPPMQVLTNEVKIPSELGLGKYPQDWTPLHILSYFGIVAKSKRLLVQGARIDANDNSFRITPLHCASSRGHSEMVQFLLDNGADGNAISRDGSTALHLATQFNQRKVMKLLLHSPVNPQVANEDGATALQMAVKTESDEATVPLLVKNKVDVNTRNIRTGDTALHLAIEWRRPRILIYLLDKGASIDMTNEDGLTPLQLAVKVDNCEAISVLLQRRANIETRSLSGTTALQIAAYENHWVSFDLLVIGGADINAWNKQGESLIHEQARTATSTAIASKLLDQGANIEAFTAKGQTPLHYAAAEPNIAMFKFLLEYGAKISTLTAKGESLLHITPPTSEDGLAILNLALEYGLAANAVSNEGWTPLHQAVYLGTGAPDHAFSRIREYIHLLLERGADVNARLQTSNAETPLHLAVTAIVPRPDLINLLLAAGADYNALTAEGKTPLHLAAERGREAIFRLLYDAGADMSLEAPDSAKADDGHGSGNTAFDLALRNPFARHWFGNDGKLRPVASDDRRRESMGTEIDEEEFIDDGVDDGDDGDDDDDDNAETNGHGAETEDEGVEVGRAEVAGHEKQVSVALGRNETPYVIV
jgi:ankyrin repeat protein